MSKAFTRESDDAPERPMPPRSRFPTNPSLRSTLTPDGAARFRSELEHLLASHEGDSTLRHFSTPATAQRVADLQRLLKTAQILPPPAPPHDQVRFGAFVTVRDSNGEVLCYRIVGLEESDPDQNWIHAQSPLAKALSGAHINQCVRFQTPAGTRELIILSIRYS